MSYCRFGEADVYVFESVDGYLECCGCALGDKWDFSTVEEMRAHLKLHQDKGAYVPADVFERLDEEEERGLDDSMAETRAAA